jgi:hypothetical protein
MRYSSNSARAYFILETTAQRAVSRLRRTNDRSVLGVHEDHEDDENAENGVVQWSLLMSIQKQGIPR